MAKQTSPAQEGLIQPWKIVQGVPKPTKENKGDSHAAD